MTELAREYGEGLFELAQDEQLLDVIGEQMNVLRDVFKANPEFIRLLESHALTKAERLDVADRTFRGQAHIYLLNFIKILIERGALDAFSDCAAHYHARYCETMGIAEADVVSASALDERQKNALIEKLSQMSGKTVRLRVSIDPSVIGGLRVDMNGHRYDNTISHRLDLMRRRLADES